MDDKCDTFMVQEGLILGKQLKKKENNTNTTNKAKQEQHIYTCKLVVQ